MMVMMRMMIMIIIRSVSHVFYQIEMICPSNHQITVFILKKREEKLKTNQCFQFQDTWDILYFFNKNVAATTNYPPRKKI